MSELTTAQTQSASISIESHSEAGSELSQVVSQTLQQQQQQQQSQEQQAKVNPLQINKNKNKPKLMPQSLVKLNINQLTPLSPEVISSQATINIGTIGHVAHGKTTVVQALSGKRTIQFTMQKIRNITIKLGYANAKIYKCNHPEHKAPSCYKSYKSQCEDILPCHDKDCPGKLLLKRHVSFVDCPGHDILMSTMLTGAAIMDAALLLIAANQTCPQPQTSEHLAAVQIMQLANIIILQNKIDIILRDSSAAKKQHQDIKKFIQNTKAQKAPIIPISAQLRYNIDVICEYLCRIPIPIRDFTSTPRMIIIRSFDVNKPGEEIDNLKGGVAGGSILRGVLKIGDQVEIRPGVIGKNQDGTIKCEPIYSKVISLRAEENDLQYAVPGGLIAVGLGVDPTLTRANRLVGMVMGYPGQLPDVIQQIDISYYLLRRLLGVRSEGGKGKKMEKVGKIKKGQVLLVNIGSNTSGGKVTNVKNVSWVIRLIDNVLYQEQASLSLLTPVCASVGEKVALSRNIDKNWRLIGWGEIKSSVKI